ncbi:MAG: hypothetical protein IAF38_02985 [Bacteroidia bacterium]|nr:hypothetical protein [Bacteroidia bacterium]
MKNYLVLLLISATLFSFAGETDIAPQYKITKTSVDNKLKTKEALFVFTFKDPLKKKVNVRIAIKCNDTLIHALPDSNSKYPIKVTPGKFKFYLVTSRWEEIVIDSIKIGNKTKIEIEVNFAVGEIDAPMKKPVIYFYPEQKTEVNVLLNVKGKLTFTYPEYKNGWNFSAEPDGTINMNEKKYNYLFWEGETNFKTDEMKMNEGYFVKTDSLLNFLETNLSAIGLNSKESQDFITYWYPLMKKNERNYVHFIFNEEYNGYANLTVLPKPDNEIRVFMLWSAVSETQELNLTKQKFLEFKRKGFSVVEWGGAELSNLFLMNK